MSLTTFCFSRDDMSPTQTKLTVFCDTWVQDLNGPLKIDFLKSPIFQEKFLKNFQRNLLVWIIGGF
jgi:uncharacterized protein Usg